MQGPVVRFCNVLQSTEHNEGACLATRLRIEGAVRSHSAQGIIRRLLDQDIDLVMSQVSCTRSKAVAALKANNNDIVEVAWVPVVWTPKRGQSWFLVNAGGNVRKPMKALSF